MREAEDDDKSKARKQPLVNGPLALAERVPLVVDIDTRVEQGDEEDGIVVAQWHGHFVNWDVVEICIDGEFGKQRQAI